MQAVLPSSRESKGLKRVRAIDFYVAPVGRARVRVSLVLHVGHALLRTSQWQYQINGSDAYNFKGRWLLTSRGLSS